MEGGVWEGGWHTAQQQDSRTHEHQVHIAECHTALIIITQSAMCSRYCWQAGYPCQSGSNMPIMVLPGATSYIVGMLGIKGLDRGTGAPTLFHILLRVAGSRTKHRVGHCPQSQLLLHTSTNTTNSRTCLTRKEQSHTPPLPPQSMLQGHSPNIGFAIAPSPSTSSRSSCFRPALSARDMPSANAAAGTGHVGRHRREQRMAGSSSRQSVEMQPLGILHGRQQFIQTSQVDKVIQG